LVTLENLAEERFFPDVIYPENKKKITDSIMASFGLTGKVPEKDFINFFITQDGHISLSVAPKYDGIQPVDLDERMAYREVFLSNTLAAGEVKIDLPEFPTEEESTAKFALGFQLVYIPFNERIQIIPIAGKLNKRGTAMISNFEYYDETSILPITENIEDEKLIRLCHKIAPEKLDNYLRRKEINPRQDIENYASTELIQYLMQYLPELFQRLSKQAFVFIKNEKNHGYYDAVPKKKNLSRIEVSMIPANLIYRLTEDEIFVDLLPVIEIEGEEYLFDDEQIEILNPVLVKIGSTIHLINGLQHALGVKNTYESSSIKMVNDHLSVFLDEYVIPLSQSFDIKFDQLSNYDMEELKVKPVKKKLYISGMGNFVLFKPVVEYEKNIDIELLKKGTPVTINGHIIHKTIRDEKYEDEFDSFFRALHPSFGKQYPHEFYNLKVDQMIEKFWFFDAFEKLKAFDVEVYGLNDLKNFKYSPFKGTVNTNLKSGKDWFEVKVQIAFGDNKVSLNEVRKALLKNERYIKLSDNSIGILPEEWLEKFNRYLRVGEIKDDKLLISKKKFPIVEELFEDIDDAEILKELAEKRRFLKEFEEIKQVKLPAGIKANLRDYQKSGFNWMCFLHSFKWGGILADDMGLGKTLQAITFLKKIAKEDKRPSLIVVPTTLIFNWENELKKFCPSLKAHYYYGSNREKNEDVFNKSNLVITTYGLVVNDIEFLKSIEFNYIILDESQAIKNPSSKRFKAVNLLTASNRIAMTGTPIENNTFDLFAQMSFVNPGFLGSANHFRDQFSTPIDRDGDKQRAAELQQMIAPFVIRRTKEQVATELPPKTEDVIYCTMDKEQRGVYDAYRNKIREQLMEKIETEGFGKSKIHVLEGLLKLRQICDSPALLSDDENYGDDSVKIKELMRHITRKTSNHKIVIFSQFVKMLALLKDEVENMNINYEYLDGQCNQKQRKASVARFQEDDNCRLFLISLKAGGTGINLTAADYVYIVDPWWNPAVENQAIDRCYRIGQDKKVFAYRMICKDTIEEKIIQYQQDKRDVAEGIIQTDENFMKKLTQDDVKAIFG
jgi:SNF2 family DNA or RNA helicase